MSARRCICTFRLNGDRPTGERMENVASFSETVTRQTFNRHQTATLREKTVRESEEKKGLIHYLPSTDCGGCGFRDAKEVFSLQKRGKLFFKLTCLHSIRHCWVKLKNQEDMWRQRLLGRSPQDDIKRRGTWSFDCGTPRTEPLISRLRLKCSLQANKEVAVLCICIQSATKGKLFILQPSLVAALANDNPTAYGAVPQEHHVLDWRLMGTLTAPINSIKMWHEGGINGSLRRC